MSPNNVTIRPTKIMNRADKNWVHLYKIKHFKNKKISKMFLIKVDFLVQYSSQILWGESFDQFLTLKNDFEFRILRCSRRLFMILESLTVSLLSENLPISTRCIHDKTLGQYLVLRVISNNQILLRSHMF